MRTSSKTTKAACWLFSAAVLLAVGVSAVRAQSALDGFDPNANGVVNVVVVQPDGKVLIGGNFTTVLGVTRNRIARLNPDGTLDSAFDPNCNFIVDAIAVQADGKILVGGTFGSIGGQVRRNIARLDPITGLADSFDPDASTGDVRSIVVQTDGKILVGGSFTSIGGQTRNYIARLDPTTGLADSFNPNANQPVRSIAVQADGKIVVGGYFSSIGGQARHGMARLNASTGLADSFDPNMIDLNGIVFSIVPQADGKILVGGVFTNIGGQARNFIARLDPTTGLADSFNPNASTAVQSIAVQADGKILVSGYFTSFAPNGGASVTRNRIARLETDGRLDQTLNLNTVGSTVLACVVQPDGKILIGGFFTSVLGATRNNIARLNADGTLDTAFDPNASHEVYAIAVQPDGKILVGGYFNGANSIGGALRNRIARLDPITGLADSFDPNASCSSQCSGSSIYTIAVQADGKILVGGTFTSIGGQPRNYIARLDPTSGSADSFDPSATSHVTTIALDASGRILVGGQFWDIGGQARNSIARLDATTGLADSFNPNVTGDSHVVLTMTTQADGKILTGGFFTGVGGQGRRSIARLDGTTGLADSLDPNANSLVRSIVVQADGKILVGGDFSGLNSIGGQARNGVARLDATTGLADSFDPNAHYGVRSIAVQADGKILAGGYFDSIGGQARSLFARLNNNTAALQNVAVTQTAITWTRGGSSVQFTRVTFEYSIDSVNYTSLGDATATGSNWALAGLNLPTGQNFYIRAHGYYRSGTQNGSESITESVQNAFLREVALVSVVSRKIHGATAFDINLPLTGNPGVECRSGGANGDYQLIFSFANTLTSVGSASVTNGTGSVSSQMIDADAHNYIVNLTGVSNAQVLTVSLTNVIDSAGNSSASVPISMGVLLGDTNGNGVVSASDIAQTKSQSGQPVDDSNFRTDLNVSGSISAADVGLAKSNSGTALP